MDTNKELVTALIRFAAERGYCGFAASFLERGDADRFVSVSGDAGVKYGGVCQAIRRNTDSFLLTLGFKVSQPVESGELAVSGGADQQHGNGTVSGNIARCVLARALFDYAMAEGTAVFDAVTDAAELLGCDVEFTALTYATAQQAQQAHFSRNKPNK